MTKDIGPAAPVDSLAYIFYEDEPRKNALTYIDQMVIGGNNKENVTGLNTDVFSHANAREVVSAYHRDLSAGKYFDFHLYRGSTNPSERAGAASTLVMQATILASALYGSQWLGRTRDLRHDLRIEPLDAFLYSQTLMARLLRLSPGRRSLNAIFGRDVTEDLAAKILERSDGIKKTCENTGRPVEEILTSTAVAFSSMASTNMVLYALRGALPFSSRRSAIAFGTQIKNVVAQPVEGSAHSVRIPVRNLVQAADFAIEATRQGARSPLNDELKEAVRHFADEAKIMLYLGNVLLAGAGKEFLVEAQEEEELNTNGQEELSAQRALAQQKRHEAHIRSQQKAEEETSKYKSILSEIDVVKEANDGFTTSWTYSGSYIRENGLNELIGHFVRGLPNAHNEIVVPGVSKEEARARVYTIEKLSTLLAEHSDAKEVWAVIGDDERAQAQLAQKANSLRQIAATLNSNYRRRLESVMPDLFSTKEQVTKLRDSYPKLRQAIRKHHPKGALTVSALDEIFESQPE